MTDNPYDWLANKIWNEIGRTDPVRIPHFPTAIAYVLLQYRLTRSAGSPNLIIKQWPRFYIHVFFFGGGAYRVKYKFKHITKHIYIGNLNHVHILTHTNTHTHTHKQSIWLVGRTKDEGWSRKGWPINATPCSHNSPIIPVAVAPKSV